MTMTKRQRENLRERIAEDMRIAMVEAMYYHVGTNVAEQMRSSAAYVAERAMRTLLRHYEIRDRRRRS